LNNELEVDIEVALQHDLAIYIPTDTMIKSWIAATLKKISHTAPVQLSIRIVDEQEISGLNKKYRNKNQATNVLSFPYQAFPGVDVSLLGDVVVCAKVVEQEAQQQYKSVEQHWAHMIVHGTLHLLGFDHIDEADAEQMENLEIDILADLGIPNPYGEIKTP